MPIRSALLALMFVLAACSNNGEARADSASTADGTELSTAAESAAVTQATEPDAASSAPTIEAEPASIEEPAVRVPANDGQIEAANWLARTAMDESSVELVWSRVDGASNYVLYRLPTVVANYDAIAAGEFDGAEEVFSGNEIGFIDTDVPPGTFLTYFLVAELDDGFTEARWAEALTVNDVTPPTPVSDLRASVTADGVLLEWSASADNVEFAAYDVSLLTEDGRDLYIGGGADEAQTSFLDTDPIAGENRYVVVAVDFHNNRSERVEITVEAE